MTEPENTKALATRAPETALARSEAWASLSDGERKLRAAEAVRDGDGAALWGLVEAYVVTFGRKGSRASVETFRAYRRGCAVLLAWATANGIKLHQLRRQDALRFTRHLEGEGLSPASVNARLAAARAVVGALTWAGLLDGDPFAKVAVSDPTPATEKRHPYTLAELAALLEAASPRERALVLLGADAGLRVAEAAALAWEDVDLGGRSLVVRSGKGGKRRTVALTQRAVEALRGHKGDTTEGAVFGVSDRRLRAILDALCDRSGVESKGVHALRHAAGTRLYRATKDLKLVARHLGHTTTRPTELYAHLADDDYRAGVDALGEAKPGTAAQAAAVA